jgi:hypothetical protein
MFVQKGGLAMKRKPMTVRRLARLLERCLSKSAKMVFLMDPEQPDPKWEDATDIAFSAYMCALEDVAAALLGDCSHLEELVDTMGMAVVLDPQRDFPFFRVPSEDLKFSEEHESCWSEEPRVRLYGA